MVSNGMMSIKMSDTIQVQKLQVSPLKKRIQKIRLYEREEAWLRTRILKFMVKTLNVLKTIAQESKFCLEMKREIKFMLKEN